MKTSNNDCGRAGGRKKGYCKQTYCYEVESVSDDESRCKEEFYIAADFVFVCPLEISCETSPLCRPDSFLPSPVSGQQFFDAMNHPLNTACSSPPISRPDWVTNIAARGPLAGVAEDGTDYNTNLPDLTDGWW